MSQSEPLQLFLELPSNSLDVVQQTTSRILLEYLQLILYQRSQIPEPVQLIQRKLNLNGDNQWKDNRVNAPHNHKMQKTCYKEETYNKKCVELIQKIGEIKKYFTKIVQQCDDFEAIFVIGSTTVTTKEAFAFTAIKHGKHTNEQCNVTTVDSHARKFCMKMVESAMDVSGEPSLTNTRVFVKMNKLKASESLISWQNFRYPSKKMKLVVTVDFTEAATPSLNNSFIDSTRNLQLLNHDDKENIIFKCEQANNYIGNDIQSSCDSTNNLISIKNVSNEDQADDVDGSCKNNLPNIPTSRHFSTAEVLEAVLADDCVKDNNHATRCRWSDTDKVTSERKTCNSIDFIWFEIPVVLRGFKF